MTSASKLYSILLLLMCMLNAQADVDVQKHPLERNGYKLNLVSYQDNAAKPVTPYPDILLVHGLTFSSHQFDLNVGDYSLAKYLAQQGFKVWLLDITGYGHSQKPDDGFIVDTEYASHDINKATDYILKTEQVDKINLLGWSWGTTTTSTFAAQHPSKLHKLILFAPIIHGLELPAPKQGYQAFTDKSAYDDLQQIKNDKIDYTITEEKVVKKYYEQLKLIDGAGSPNGSRRDLFQSKNIQLIPYMRIQTPTLFIAGTQDPYLDITKDFNLLMKNAPKGSCEVVIDGAGHNIFIEKPFYKKFRASVVHFLKHGCME